MLKTKFGRNPMDLKRWPKFGFKTSRHTSWRQTLMPNSLSSVCSNSEHSKLLTYASEPNSKYLQQNIGKKRGYDAGDAFPPFIKITMVCANMRCQNQMKKSQRGLNLKSACSTFSRKFVFLVRIFEVACYLSIDYMHLSYTLYIVSYLKHWTIAKKNL